ncbi:uncharacterized protein LOC125856122 [Solanum stenotomum]|uniref:uncharacterized protein LOC125856122 n=1 Tax=Solanum stenotomum TaxID=172797 RepID=UPI0020D12784|nr:uncharacterized protein LOC125856122 [Solanum stenotomum]
MQTLVTRIGIQRIIDPVSTPESVGVLDAEIHLTAKGLGDSIIEGNTTPSQDKTKAMIFLRHHLDESLKVEYFTVKDPLELWIGLKGRYDHVKATVLPRARYEWMHLRFWSKFTTAKPEKPESKSKLYATAWRLRRLVRPAGSAPLPEAHGAEAHGQSEIRQNNRGYENVCGRVKGKRRYNNRRGGGHNKRENNMGSQNNPSKEKGDYCHRYGLKGNWKNECRAPEHFVRLYQNSFKRKGNKGGASSSNAQMESHLTLKDDV